MKNRLMQLIDAFRELDAPSDGRTWTEHLADHLLANGVIVPPVKVEPIISVSKRPFHNRIEVVKNTRYEWNEAQFCFSQSEAERVESEWKALAEREGKG